MRPFNPTTEDIARRIVARVIGLSDEEVSRLLDEALGEFENRHEQVVQLFRNRFTQVRHYVDNAGAMSPERQALIGSK